MPEPAIPTMPCPECAGHGSFYDRPWACCWCGETGRVERPPLTPEEVAALPLGERVVLHAGWRKRLATRVVHGLGGIRVVHLDGWVFNLVAQVADSDWRVWLAGARGDASNNG